MSTPQSIETGAEEETANVKRPKKPGRQLRPLAPKPASPRPPLERSRTAPSLKGLPRRFKSSPLACPVCGNIGCRLPTHRAFSTLPRSTGSSSAASVVEKSSTHSQLEETPYVHSYGFIYSQYLDPRAYVDFDISASRIDPFFDLPVSQEDNSPEMHRLFHDYFTIECSRTFNIPRPPEIASDIILSPFFVPAMTDPALCLSVLACAAAAIPNRSGQPTRNVTALTLVGRAMQSLRERMSSSPDHITDSTIVAATFLWGVNSLLADRPSMQPHAASVRALVAARGGLDKLGIGGAVSNFVTWIDILHGMITIEPCTFPQVPDPGTFRDPPARINGLFFETERSNELLDPRVSTACRDLCGDTDLLHKAILTGVNGSEYVHLLSRLQSHSSSRTSLHVEFHDSGSINECVLLAGELFSILFFHTPKDQKMLTLNNITRIVRAIQKTGGPSVWANDLPILAWILLLIQFVSHDFEEKEWCMKLLARTLICRFGSDEWPDSWQEQLREDLRQFIWLDIRCAEMFEEICQSARLQKLPGCKEE